MTGSCTVNATNPLTGECNGSICPYGCAPCDETDECHKKYHETDCNMLSHAPEIHESVPDFNFCLEECMRAGVYTYATWSRRLEECR